MRHGLISCMTLAVMSVWAAEPARQLRFSLPPSSLDFAACLAQPGDVPIPLSQTNINLEVMDWATVPSTSDQAGEFMFALTKPALVGTVMAYGAKEVRYLVGDTWKTLEVPKTEAGRPLQILPFPLSTTIRSIKILAPSVPSGQGADGKPQYRATLPFLTLIPLRLQRLSVDMTVMTSSIADGKEAWARSELLLDGEVKADRNFAVGERPGPVSAELPEWILLSWKPQQSVRGIWLLRGKEDEGLGQFKVDLFTGEGDPWASGNQEDWKDLMGAWSAPGGFRSHEFCAFFATLVGTGLRLTSTNGVSRPGLGELVVVQEAVVAP